jgi:tRNA dimethylallyltransferase
MGKPELLVITGPTATGKTALGALVAKDLGGEIVSADSMQIYKRMDIGTAKPTEAEMLGVPHHMLDIVQPWEDYSVALYVSDASRCVEDIIARGKLPIIVGGTGLYIDSLLIGRGFPARPDPAIRRGLEREYSDIGGEAMLRRLGEVDPERAAALHPNDKKRIVRAFEVYLAKNDSPEKRETDVRDEASEPPEHHGCAASGNEPRVHAANGDTPTPQTRPYAAVKLALNYTERPRLYEKIDRRVDAMFAAGLEGEVRTLLDMGVSPDCTAMQAIGYKETAAAINGEYGMDEAVEKIKLNSRRYAKRQLTWLRRDTETIWIEWGDNPDLKRGLHEAKRFIH